MDKNDQLLRAVQTATRKLASSGHFNALLRDVLAICVDAVGASGGTIYVHDPAKKLLKFQHVLPEEVADKMPFDGIPDDAGVAGKVFRTRQTQINYFEHSDENTRKEVESATGVFVRTMITVPLMMEDEQPIGIVQLINKKSGDFDETDVAVLDTVAAVSTMAYLNSRLTEESTRASTLLGMGKVSHDIGNLAASLYANISFSELAMDGMRDHLKEIGASDTSEMYLESLDSMFIELKASVDRIVGYSRLISDLSAGRELRPNKIMAPLSDTIQTSAAYLESEGRKNRVALLYDIQTGTPPLLHDELYLFRIVQNLVGNAIKAVRETVPEDWEQQLDSDDDAIFGEVVVRYRYNDPDHVVEVQDSGPGMKPDVAEKILLGTARSEWDRGGGSGWGTKIVLELAATHKAKVSIDSELGKGSIFRVTFPATSSSQETERAKEASAQA